MPGQAKTIISWRLAAPSTGVFYLAISRKDRGLHTGPKMSVSSIAGDVIRTRVDFRETEEMGIKAKSQMLYHLSYLSLLMVQAIF